MGVPKSCLLACKNCKITKNCKARRNRPSIERPAAQSTSATRVKNSPSMCGIHGPDGSSRSACPSVPPSVENCNGDRHHTHPCVLLLGGALTKWARDNITRQRACSDLPIIITEGRCTSGCYFVQFTTPPVCALSCTMLCWSSGGQSSRPEIARRHSSRTRLHPCCDTKRRRCSSTRHGDWLAVIWVEASSHWKGCVRGGREREWRRGGKRGKRCGGVGGGGGSGRWA